MLNRLDSLPNRRLVPRGLGTGLPPRVRIVPTPLSSTLPVDVGSDWPPKILDERELGKALSDSCATACDGSALLETMLNDQARKAVRGAVNGLTPSGCSRDAHAAEPGTKARQVARLEKTPYGKHRSENYRSTAGQPRTGSGADRRAAVPVLTHTTVLNFLLVASILRRTRLIRLRLDWLNKSQRLISAARIPNERPRKPRPIIAAVSPATAFSCPGILKSVDQAPVLSATRSATSAQRVHEKTVAIAASGAPLPEPLKTPGLAQSVSPWITKQQTMAVLGGLAISGTVVLNIAIALISHLDAKPLKDGVSLIKDRTVSHFMEPDNGGRLIAE